MFAVQGSVFRIRLSVSFKDDDEYSRTAVKISSEADACFAVFGFACCVVAEACFRICLVLNATEGAEYTVPLSPYSRSIILFKHIPEPSSVAEIGQYIINPLQHPPLYEPFRGTQLLYSGAYVR